MASLTPKPMRAGSWARLVANAETLTAGGEFAQFLPPVTGLDLRLGNRYVRMIGMSPKGRHIHYEILLPRKRKNQAPRRGWMSVAKFLQRATVCGFFRRMPSGELAWIEPMELYDEAPADE